MDGSLNDNARDERNGENLFASAPQSCAACGASARRARARFCATCGRSLAEDYFPTDSLRASYRFERAPSPRAKRKPEILRREHAHVSTAHARMRRDVMPERRGYDAVTATARAFVTYALVPYLGILFCPGALLLGGIGYLRARRAPQARRAAVSSIALGLLTLFVQLALWWILYKVPEWSRGPVLN